MGGIILGIVVLNYFQKKNNNPKIFYHQKLVGGYNGFAVPMVGIFLKEVQRGNENLLLHEKTHWQQYQREGFWKFLFGYAK